MSRWVPRIRRDFVLVVFFAVLVVAMACWPARGRAAGDELAALQSRARAARLAESRDWQTLVHYRPKLGGGWRSDADGLGFFFAGAAGKTDPARELAATLTALTSPAVPADPAHPEESQHPQCRFPARWTYLKTALALDPARFPDQPCPLFQTWRSAIAVEKVTLVYAAAYLNSPASMYGHTFLRLSRATGGGNPLLDYILNFAADVDTENGLLYAMKGLFGLFPGRFYVMPFYVKIQEYSNIESRDLWEYELSLTPAQGERLVAHAWETRTTHFDYYFFSENCSYFLLALLEAADPSLHLLDKLSAWVIPADTVRVALGTPGFVRGVAPRPSLRAVMMKRKAGLDSDELSAAEALAASGKGAASEITTRSPDRQAAVLDAAYERLRYREGFKEPPSERFVKTERDLLILRGKTGVPAAPLVVSPAVAAPESGHLTLRLAAAGGVARAGGQLSGFQELALRVTLHDHLDRPDGYVAGAILEMGDFRLRIDDQLGKVALERAEIVHLVSPSPIDRWSTKTSWFARFGAGQQRELGCAGWSCLAGSAAAGGGGAVTLGRPLLLYAFFASDVAAGPAFRDDYRIALAAIGTAVLQLGSRARLQVDGKYLVPLLGDDRRLYGGRGALAIDLGLRAQLRFEGELDRLYREGRAALLAYF